MTATLLRPRRLALALVVALAASLSPAAHAVAAESDDDPGTGAEDDADEPLAIRSSVEAVGAVTPDVRIQGSGWGHGVGMSQYGAYAQAQAGHSASEILDSYYSGTDVTTDTRASERRIRVSILDDIASTTVEAVDGPVEWQRCRPDPAEDESRGGRVTQCREDVWFTQPQGSTLAVCPFREADVDEETGEPIPEDERRNGIRLLHADDFAADGCDGEVYRYTLAYSVARVNHDGTTIETPAHFAAQRLYRHGWRDLHSRNDGTTLDSVQDIPSIERYLRGLAEVPSSWGVKGPAALEAQAITGRTFAVGRLGIAGGCACDIRATPADQNYTGYSKESEEHGDLWVAAVDATTDRVLTYEGDLAQTFYSSSHGGRTENIEDSWAYGDTAIPYLRSVDDPWSNHPSANNVLSDWAASADNRVMADFLSAGQSPAITRVERMRVRSRTDGGTPRELDVTGSTSGGERVSFTTDLAARYAKGIAGAAMRRELALVAGGLGGKLRSSQIQGFGFEPFDDDDATVHEYAITWAAEAGIVRGVTETEYAPGRAVTRAQMATFLVNTFDIPTASESADFPDVTPGSTHAAAIDALAESGLTGGFEDGTYRPERSVTREQMASFLARALALSSDADSSFSDVTADNVHGEAIAAIADRDITQGCEADRFCPRDPVERGQMAAFMQRLVLG